MLNLCYSPFPHAAYLTYGKGPGAEFLGDLEMCNWRWLRDGANTNPAFDAAIPKHFNAPLRQAMQQRPGDLLEWFKEVVPDLNNEEIAERLIDAQARLFPPVVVRNGNLIFADFTKSKP